MTRKQIQIKIKKKQDLIKAIEQDIKELFIKNILLCDEDYWYEEKEEEYFISKRPKVQGKRLVGRQCWKEDFIDEDTGEIVSIQKSRVYKVDGEWLF